MFPLQLLLYCAFAELLILISIVYNTHNFFKSCLPSILLSVHLFHFSSYLSSLLLSCIYLQSTFSELSNPNHIVYNTHNSLQSFFVLSSIFLHLALGSLLILFVLPSVIPSSHFTCSLLCMNLAILIILYFVYNTPIGVQMLVPHKLNPGGGGGGGDIGTPPYLSTW